MSTGEIRQLPAVMPVPKLQSLPRFSPVDELRNATSTFFSPSSSVAVPLKVILLPGSAVTAGTVNGGVISTGWLIVTVGATAVESTVQSRVALRRSAWPMVSTAVALPRHTPSCGSVTSYDQVAFVAPMTSGVPRNVWKMSSTVPSACR